MRMIINYVVELIKSYVRDFIFKAKIKRINKKIKKEKELMNEKINTANNDYDDFMESLRQYELQRSLGKMRSDSGKSEKGDKVSGSSDKDSKQED